MSNSPRSSPDSFLKELQYSDPFRVNLSTAVRSSSQGSDHDSFQKDGDTNSPKTCTLNSPFGSTDIFRKDGDRLLLDSPYAFPDVFISGESQTSQVMGPDNLESLSLSMSPTGSSQSSCVTAASQQQISPTVTDCVVMDPNKIGSDNMDQKQIVPSRKQGADDMEAELEEEALAFAGEEASKCETAKDVIKSLTAQVETLTRKTRLQEAEMERKTKLLKETIAIARKEARKVKTAREFINSLTVQLKDIVERLPVGDVKSSPFASYNVSSALVDHTTNGQLASQEPDTNVPSIPSLRNATTKQDQFEVTARIGTITKDSESSNHEAEWVVQVEPGVYITLISMPSGVKDLKRVRFSRKRFNDVKQAKQWWAENRARIYQQYTTFIVRSIDKSSEDFDLLANSTQN